MASNTTRDKRRSRVEWRFQVAQTVVFLAGSVATITIIGKKIVENQNMIEPTPIRKVLTWSVLVTLIAIMLPTLAAITILQQIKKFKLRRLNESAPLPQSSTCQQVSYIVPMVPSRPDVLTVQPTATSRPVHLGSDNVTPPPDYNSFMFRTSHYPTCSSSDLAYQNSRGKEFHHPTCSSSDLTYQNSRGKVLCTLCHHCKDYGNPKVV